MPAVNSTPVFLFIVAISVLQTEAPGQQSRLIVLRYLSVTRCREGEPRFGFPFMFDISKMNDIQNDVVPACAGITGISEAVAPGSARPLRFASARQLLVR
jgi:hypothetical protein